MHLIEVSPKSHRNPREIPKVPHRNPIEIINVSHRHPTGTPPKSHRDPKSILETSRRYPTGILQNPNDFAHVSHRGRTEIHKKYQMDPTVIPLAQTSRRIPKLRVSMCVLPDVSHINPTPTEITQTSPKCALACVCKRAGRRSTQAGRQARTTHSRNHHELFRWFKSSCILMRFLACHFR